MSGNYQMSRPVGGEASVNISWAFGEEFRDLDHLVSVDCAIRSEQDRNWIKAD